jgi:hypothetical protein
MVVRILFDKIRCALWFETGRQIDRDVRSRDPGSDRPLLRNTDFVARVHWPTVSNYDTPDNVDR